MEKQLEFPMDIYPPLLRQVIEDTHRDLNFPVNYIAASLLMAVSVAVGNSRIDKVLTGGMNIDSNGQSQAPSVHESRSPEQNQSMTSDLANIASELTIGLISYGQEKKSEEEDFAPQKKRGIRL